MISPFNTPVETGTRVLVILAHNASVALDLNRLVLFDHWLLHSGDFGGPPSLHPSIPVRSGEFGLKRHDLAMGIEVMLRAGLIDLVAQSGGIGYRANASGVSFLGLLEAPYVEMLMGRAEWLSSRIHTIEDESDLRSAFSVSLDHWSAEVSRLRAISPPSAILGNGT